MRLLNKLEARFGRYAVPNVTVAIIFCQVLVYVMAYMQPGVLENLLLVPEHVFDGEVWLVFTFLAVPPSPNPGNPISPIFAFFFWYLFYIFGTALEHTWGVFKYNLFLLIGYVATVGVALAIGYFVDSKIPANNGFLQLSVFLAFAVLYPDFQLLLFFLLPVKIKWLAIVTWIMFFFSFVRGGWLERLVIIASVANYFLFFGQDIYLRLRSGQRKVVKKAGKIATKNRAFHRCEKCGITDQSHPKMLFRYRAEEDGVHCYCADCLSELQPVAQGDQPPQDAS